MKTKKSIAHSSSQEREALISLRKKLIEVYNPLLIYLIAIENTHSFKRDSLAYPMKNIQNRFRIDVLVIVSDSPILFSHLNEIDKVHSNIDEVNLITYPLGQFQNELTNQTVFFSAIQKRSIVLHERANSLEELPENQFVNQIHKEELIQYTSQNPNYKNHQVDNLLFSNGKQLENIQNSLEVPILSQNLQEAFATLLNHHGAKVLNTKIRKVILEYAYSSTKFGIYDDFEEILMYFRDIMEVFDIAELEFKIAK